MTGGVTWTEIPGDIRQKYKFRRRTDLPGTEKFGTPVQVKVSARPPGGGPRIRQWIWSPTFPSARNQQDALLIPWGPSEQRSPSYAQDLPSAPSLTLPTGEINVPDGGTIEPPPDSDQPTSGSGGDGSGDGFEIGEAIAAFANGIFQDRRSRGSTLPTRSQTTTTRTAGFGSTLGIVALVGGVGLAAYLITSNMTQPAPPPQRALPRENKWEEEEDEESS